MSGAVSGASEAVKSQLRAGPLGAAVDDAALRAWVGALRLRDFAITDERGSARPLDLLHTAEAPSLYVWGKCDNLVSGVLQMVSIAEWRALPDVSGAAEPAVLVMGAKRGRWYTLATPTAAYASLFAALHTRLRAAASRDGEDEHEQMPALRAPPPMPASAAVANAVVAAPPPPPPPAPIGFSSDSDVESEEEEAPALPPGLAAAAAQAAAPAGVTHGSGNGGAVPPPIGFGGSDSDSDSGPLPALRPPPPKSAAAAGVGPAPAFPAAIAVLPPPIGFSDSDEGIAVAADSSDDDDAPALPPALAAAAAAAAAAVQPAMNDPSDAVPAHSGGGGGGAEPELSDVDALHSSDDDEDDSDAAPELPPGLAAAAATAAGGRDSPSGSGLSDLMSEEEAGARGDAQASSTVTEPPLGGGAAAECDDARSEPPAAATAPIAPIGFDSDDDGGDDAALAAEADAALAERWQANDTQCGICDDGGDLLLCEGPCMRSFHPCCIGKGMPSAMFDALASSAQPWLCPSCETGRQRCFQCLEEGPATDAAVAAGSKERRVHKCSVFECSRFYHPECAAAAAAGNLRHGSAPLRAPFATAATAAPEAFTCPQHVCKQCRAGAAAALGPLVRCRRCPAAFHVACMADAGLDVDRAARPRRVWLSARDGEGGGDAEVDTSLVYCLAHPMAPGDAEPARGRDEVFPEKLLHAAAAVIAARDGAASRCLGCGVMVRNKRTLDEAWGRAGIGCAALASSAPGAPGDSARLAQLRVAGRARALRELAAASREQPVQRHDAALSGGGECYRARARRTVAPERLAEMEASVRESMRAAERGDASAAAALLSERLRAEFRASYLSLRVANAPFMYRTKYTSYGRHFTEPARLRAAAARTALFMRHGDTVIDFSAGANDWLPAVAARACAAGLRGLSFRAFDVFPAMDHFGFTEKDWFTVQRADVGGAPGDRCVVGLNPPFGTDGALAAKFVAHAVAALQPRLLVLITPRETPLPADYVELERNTRLADGHAFYLPGSYDPVTQRPVEDWNKQTPPFIVMMRRSAIAAQPSGLPVAEEMLRHAWRARPNTAN